MNDLLKINPDSESKRIIDFIKTTLYKQGFKNVIIGLSGGIDSAVSLSLATKAIPAENIFIAHLHYFDSQLGSLKMLLQKSKIPQSNIYNISIKKAVDEMRKTAKLNKNSSEYKLRLGNIMARTRMIFLYDLAKKHKGLVCGTENKSELLLGYFTRFGDEASDFEPIQHLYKTQVYQLARYLEIPKEIIDAPPTAGLWSNQTDEKEFGFSYKEADRVLNLHLQKKTVSQIISQGLPNAQRIIDRVNKNSFKHNIPYTVQQSTS